MERGTVQDGSGRFEHDDGRGGDFSVEQEVIETERLSLGDGHDTGRGAEDGVGESFVQKGVMVSGPIVIEIKEDEDFLAPNEVAPDAGQAGGAEIGFIGVVKGAGAGKSPNELELDGDFA